jgi:hypothetical protein
MGSCLGDFQYLFCALKFHGDDKLFKDTGKELEVYKLDGDEFNEKDDLITSYKERLETTEKNNLVSIKNH